MDHSAEMKIASHRPSNQVTSKGKLELVASGNTQNQGHTVARQASISKDSAPKKFLSKTKFDTAKAFGQEKSVAGATNTSVKHHVFNSSVYNAKLDSGTKNTKGAPQHRRTDLLHNSGNKAAVRTIRSDQQMIPIAKSSTYKEPSKIPQTSI